MMRRALFLVLLVALVRDISAKRELIEFKIVPGAAGEVSVALDTPPIAGSTCNFEWTAQGATPEAWTASVWGDPSSGDLSCEIERAGGAHTYLMFQKFRTTLGTAPILDASLYGNEGPLDNAHVIDEECVKNAHDWAGGSVRRIHLVSEVDI